jgi:beta-phosphoglucomutase-like phosphatase (HAD superfamily)
MCGLSDNLSWSPKMIIFDKDGKFFFAQERKAVLVSRITCPFDDLIPLCVFLSGTLGDCTQALHTWCKRMSQRIAEECKNHNLESHQILSILSIFHSTVGWDAVNEIILPSAIVSSGTWQRILDATVGVLNGHIANAQQKVEYWHDTMGDIHANDEPLVSDLAGLMRTLKQQCEGILIAICTSDDRRATNACIKNWGLEDLIDVSTCKNEMNEASLSKNKSH